MSASSSVDVVTAIAVGGRGWAGGGTGVPVISGVDLVTAVGGRACADVDLVIAVGGRACADVDFDVTAVGLRAGGGAGGGVDVSDDGESAGSRRWCGRRQWC